jgi:hypothetical protein
MIILLFFAYSTRCLSLPWSSAFFKKIPEYAGAFLIKNTGNNLDLMVQSLVIKNLVKAIYPSRLLIPAAINQTCYS